MKNPYLEIVSEEGDPILKGRCSSCEGVTFSLSGSAPSSLALIHEMFSEHLRKVHFRRESLPAEQN
jgi:hypothetical protein